MARHKRKHYRKARGGRKHTCRNCQNFKVKDTQEIKISVLGTVITPGQAYKINYRRKDGGIANYLILIEEIKQSRAGAWYLVSKRLDLHGEEYRSFLIDGILDIEFIESGKLDAIMDYLGAAWEVMGNSNNRLIN